MGFAWFLRPRNLARGPVFVPIEHRGVSLYPSAESSVKNLLIR